MTYDASEKLRYGGAPVEGFKFTYGAGTIVRYTSADASISLPDGTFTTTFIQRGEVSNTSEDTTGSVEIMVDRQNTVAQLFAIVSPIPLPTLTIFRAHRGSESDAVAIFIGTVVGCEFNGQDARLICAPISQQLARAIPTMFYHSQCAWNLYGTGCGVNKASFTVNGTITAIGTTTPTITATAFGTKPTDWFRNGFAVAPNGDRAFIVSNTGNVITLARAFQTLSVGNVVAAYAGCDRTEAVCASKFNNLVRHLGFPRIPNRNPHARDDAFAGRRNRGDRRSGAGGWR